MRLYATAIASFEHEALELGACTESTTFGAEHRHEPEWTDGSQQARRLHSPLSAFGLPVSEASRTNSTPRPTPSFSMTHPPAGDCVCQSLAVCLCHVQVSKPSSLSELRDLSIAFHRVRPATVGGGHERDQRKHRKHRSALLRARTGAGCCSSRPESAVRMD